MIKIYLILSAIVNIGFVYIFKDHLNITGGSLAPAFILCLMIFLSIIHYHNRGKFDFNSNNFSDLSEEQWQKVSVYISTSMLIFAPLNIPFIFFFGNWAKLLSFFTLWCGYIAGPTYYKLKNRR